MHVTHAPHPSVDLVPVFAGTIGGETVNVCNARELHAYLGSREKFADWIKARIARYGFQAGMDYDHFSDSPEKPRPGRPALDYVLSLDMAKELAMLDNSPQGRTVRRYFIELERRQVAPAHAPVTHALTTRQLDELRDAARRVTVGWFLDTDAARAWVANRIRAEFGVPSMADLPAARLPDALALLRRLQIEGEHVSHLAAGMREAFLRDVIGAGKPWTTKVAGKVSARTEWRRAGAALMASAD